MNDKLLDDHGYEVAERAAILEFDAGMTREEAERVAVEGKNLTKGPAFAKATAGKNEGGNQGWR